MRGQYESDVRFEHCMALDTRADIKPTIRRSCWEEWLKFYTFGQTRDRIDHAQKRDAQLASASDFDEPDWTPPQGNGLSRVSDPISAIAPPPILFVTDAGLPDASPSLREGATFTPCAADCQQTLEACRKDCKTAPCTKACGARYKHCSKRCN